MAARMGESHASQRAQRARLPSWAVVIVVVAACKSDPETPPPQVIDPPSELCPDVDPLSGPFAMKGACCYRTSNKLKLERSETGTAELEFRMMASQVVTQPLTVGSAVFVDFVQRGYDLNRSVSLIRIREFPTEPPGEVVIETGAGRFNPDGTYSFLKDAAPVTSQHPDRSRWDAVSTAAYYDPSADEGERFVPLDPDLTSRLLLTPEWQPNGRLDYELPQFSPRVLSMTLDDDLNCIGERGDQTRWVSRDEIESYVPIDEASQEMLSAGWSLCTSMAFGFLAGSNRNCENTPRMLWVEKPTGMCEDGVCYVGGRNDPSADCRNDPNATDDPRPLCCDPSGDDPVLPACNAFHVRARYVAAAVEITDEPVNDGSPILPDSL